MVIIFTSSALGKLPGSRNFDLKLQSPWMVYQRASKIFVSIHVELTLMIGDC